MTIHHQGPARCSLARLDYVHYQWVHSLGLDNSAGKALHLKPLSLLMDTINGLLDEPIRDEVRVHLGSEVRDSHEVHQRLYEVLLEMLIYVTWEICSLFHDS